MSVDKYELKALHQTYPLYKAVAEAGSIIDEYVRPGAKHEINLSADLRNEVLDTIGGTELRGDAVRTVFEKAREEIASMIDGGHFVERFVDSQSHNIVAAQRRYFAISGVLEMLAAFALFIVLWLFSDTNAVVRLACMPLLCFGSNHLIQASLGT